LAIKLVPLDGWTWPLSCSNSMAKLAIKMCNPNGWALGHQVVHASSMTSLHWVVHTNPMPGSAIKLSQLNGAGHWWWMVWKLKIAIWDPTWPKQSHSWLMAVGCGAFGNTIQVGRVLKPCFNIWKGVLRFQKTKIGVTQLCPLYSVTHLYDPRAPQTAWSLVCFVSIMWCLIAGMAS
jgi:hypothetical protein